MPNLTMAAEWATYCHKETHWIAWSAGQGGADKILCIKCTESYARQRVEATKQQAREELAAILNGQSPLVVDPIFDALTVATAIVGREMKRVEAFRERAQHAICEGCRDRLPTFQDGAYIGHKQSNKSVLTCKAAAIRALEP